MRRTQMLQQNLFISAPTLSQVAATVALSERDYYEEQKAHYAANRMLLSAGAAQPWALNRRCLGRRVLCLCRHIPLHQRLAGLLRELLEEAGVAATPGIDFDRVNGQGLCALSYAGRRDSIELALDRMGRLLR